MMRTNLLLLLMTCVTLLGCNSTPKPPPKPVTVSKLRVVHHLGGTHYRAVTNGEVWYQTFNQQLLVLPLDSVSPLKAIDFGKFGETGPAIDLLMDATRQRLFAVIEDDELVELSIETPLSPTIVERISATELGIKPRRLSMIDDEVFASGVGGIVRLRDGRKIFSNEGDVSRVAKTDLGMVACVGRRAFRVDDGRYVGSASELQSFAGGEQKLLFQRQGEEGALVGLMSADVREIDAKTGTVAAPGHVRSVRIIGDRLWIVSDASITGYAIQENSLSEPLHVNVLGGFDLAPAGANALAIAGTFGRAIYEFGLQQATNGPQPVGDTVEGSQPASSNSRQRTAEGRFVQVHREPSRLSYAMTDGRNILAGSHEGLWMYLINSRAELTTRQFERQPPEPSLSATVMNSQAKISEDRRSLKISQSEQATPIAEPFVFTLADDCLLHCVTAVDGEFWVGHDRGVTVLRPQPPVIEKSKGKGAAAGAFERVRAEVRLPGRVRYIYPLLVGGGASYVSEYGGFGVLQFVDEPTSPSLQATSRN
jgi:hypothetical protein